MPEPISALEHTSAEYIREVNQAAIAFYVNDLSGLYLPEEYRAANADESGVRAWDNADRLSGKFARFTVKEFLHEESEDTVPLDEILLMGTTVGLMKPGDRRSLSQLKHWSLHNFIPRIAKQRGWNGREIDIRAADYGRTLITTGENGTATQIIIGGSSSDYGRADAEGRVKTCQSFAEAIGGTIQVVNAEPEPTSFDEIIKPTN